MGSDTALEFIHMETAEHMAEESYQATDRFRQKTERGILEINLNYYVAVIFMADQLNAEMLIHILSQFHLGMARAGVKDQFEMTLYCIFNYETMDGKTCLGQLQELKQTALGICGPIFIFTQNNSYSCN